ncbi:SbcC-like subunit of palindrome specific endonuclease [Synechococcus phage S-SM1]|jgi:DNA repair exonuclease SbcCD ATPase subunit|uniref:Recombination endonuclease subunit n=1 Tax=Synechococcus phage S-SM1 TaxID=444859 RepID=E3SIF6_9CAUD|nr:SbcC-like subunit of palindrome specific endonuclease [Synechococcus phage S-SM1]ADO97201.1 recombination endonuclease subunit [Synechococcus phage S-SM1]
MIIFESIRWKNFLSTGDQWTEIDLNEYSSTLIVGTNGAGKSTMLDALCFGLFNKPFRKINRGQLVNSINEKSTKVEVCFSIGKDEYRVFRGIKPNVFELYKNNKLVDQDAAAKDTQKYLEQSVLKLNFKSFTQVVILGSSTFVPFMQLPAAHRREVIEDLLDINIFSNMNQLLKDRVRTAQSQSNDCTHLLNIAEERVESQERLIQSLAQVNTSRQQEKEDKIKTNLESIESVKAEKEKYELQLIKEESNLVGVDNHKELLTSLRQTQSDTNSELKSAAKELKFFKTHDECPTCSQQIEKEFKNAAIGGLEQKGKKLTKEIKSLTEQINDTVTVIEQMDAISKQCFETRNKITRSEREIVRLEFENLNLKDELIKLQTDTPNMDKEKESLVSFQNDLETTKTDCGKISQTLDEYRVVSNLLKDSGIKSQIIKKYVPIFNNLINKYLHSMDFFVNFTLDEEFGEVIKSRFRDEFSYSSFSEGEKQKIDLALLFTWREVARMKNSVATNLLILDEVFDSSLDASATGELLSILRSLGNDANVFVISHKGDILVDKFLRTIKFEKVNDFSKMSDDS